MLAAASLALNQRGEGSTPSGPNREAREEGRGPSIFSALLSRPAPPTSAGVARVAERRLRNAECVGSTPTAGSVGDPSGSFVACGRDSPVQLEGRASR